MVQFPLNTLWFKH